MSTSESAPSQTGARSPRSLAPREHGAWGQLGLPLAVALARPRPTVAALLLAAAVVLVFLAHEPLLVLLGQRGPRARTHDGSRAARRLILLGVLAAGLGAGGLLLSAPMGRLAVVVPAVLALVVAGLVAAHREKSTGGELVVATALASAALPVAVAAGTPPTVALTALAAWAIGFAFATASVRSLLGRRHQRREPLVVPTLVAGTLALALGTWAGARELLAALPLLVAALTLLVVRPHPRALPRVGWALVAASVAEGVLLVALY